MNEWTRTLVMALVMAVVCNICIDIGLLTFQTFVVWNLSILVARAIRRTP